MTRFTRGMLEVDETDDKVQLTIFKAGLKSRDFVASLAKNPPKTMAEEGYGRRSKRAKKRPS